MPGLDRTGPMGEGSRTGRQMGRCASPGKSWKRETDPEEPNETDPRVETDEEFDLNAQGAFRGRGFGFGAGRGAGWGPGGGRGRGRGRGPGRGMGRGGGGFRRRNRGD